MQHMTDFLECTKGERETRRKNSVDENTTKFNWGQIQRLTTRTLPLTLNVATLRSVKFCCVFSSSLLRFVFRFFFAYCAVHLTIESTSFGCFIIFCESVEWNNFKNTAPFSMSTKPICLYSLMSIDVKNRFRVKPFEALRNIQFEIESKFVDKLIQIVLVATSVMSTGNQITTA